MAPAPFKNPVSSRSPLIVGVDDRPGWIRLATSEGHCHEVLGPSVLTGEAIRTVPDFVSDGAAFTVSQGGNTEPAGDLLSASHRILVHHALATAGLGGHPVLLISTLPAVEYFSGHGGRENIGLIRAKTSSLETDVRSTGSTPVAQVRMSYVFAQGVAAWVDFALDQHGRVRHNLGQAAAIVEVGARSTYCTAVLPGYAVDIGRCGTISIGLLDLVEMVGQAMRRRFGIEAIPLDVALAAIRTGFLEHETKVYEVRAIVAAAQSDFVSRLQEQVIRRLGAPEEFYQVLYVGPGASLLPQLRLVADNADIPENPHYAGARGLVKYARHLL